MNDIGVFSEWAEDLFSFFLMTLPRILGFFTGFPILGTSLISSLIVRVIIASSFCLFLHPILTDQLGDFSAVQWGPWYSLKEFLIGWISGFLLTMPLWVSLMIGDIVESQRGGMATDNADPFTGVQSSAYGALITSSLFMFVILYGSFHVLIHFIFKSYIVWPVTSFFPDFDLVRSNGILVFTSVLFETMLLLAAPLLMMMFLCEFGLALVNRFSPPLNVFVLSMPVKSVISIFTLALVLENMLFYLNKLYEPSSILFSIVNGLIR